MWRELNASPEVNIALLLFSASVVLCLLIGTCAGGAKKHLFMKHYIALLTVDIVMQLGEAGIWIFEGPFLVKLSCLMSFGGGVVMQKNKKNGEKTSTIGVVFLCAAIRSCHADCATGSSVCCML